MNPPGWSPFRRMIFSRKLGLPMHALAAPEILIIIIPSSGIGGENTTKLAAPEILIIILIQFGSGIATTMGEKEVESG